MAIKTRITEMFGVETPIRLDAQALNAAPTIARSSATTGSLTPQTSS